ncbi:MAG: DUF4198 domain-containing protein [Candidatus Aminicenantia bacterium]
MPKRINFIILIYWVILLVCTRVAAHDLWLVPQKFRINPGDLLILSANTGMDFPNSLSAITPNRIDKFFVVGKSGRKEVTEFKIKGKSLIAELNFEMTGTYIVAAALKPMEIKLSAEDFNQYLLHDGLSEVYNLRKRENILDKDAVEHYSKFPKSIIQVGEKLDEIPTQPINLILEIVPTVNPYKLKVSDSLWVTVLFRGKPLANAELAWSYPGKGKDFAGSTRTNVRGQANIPLERSGPYVIRMTHMEWVKKQTHEWESYWASLTFEVPGKNSR